MIERHSRTLFKIGQLCFVFLAVILAARIQLVCLWLLWRLRRLRRLLRLLRVLGSGKEKPLETRG